MNSSPSSSRDAALVTHYTGQAGKLPDSVRRAVEAEWGGQPVQLYALADLDEQLHLVETWFCLGPTHLAVARVQGDARAPALEAVAPPDRAGRNGNGRGLGPIKGWHRGQKREPVLVRSWARSTIGKVRSQQLLSHHEIVIEGQPGESPLAVIRYSHRQRQAIGAITYVLEHPQLDHQLHEADGDSIYAEGVAGPIRKAQASVTKNKAAVFLRLMGYLKPYKWLFGFGVLATLLSTVCGLVPPYLSGLLVDDVVLAYSEGRLNLESAQRMGATLLVCLVVLLILREVFLWARLRYLAVIGEYVARDLRSHLYNHLHTLSVSYFSDRQTGSIISRVSSDTDRLWDFIAFGMAELLLATLTIIGLGVVLVMLDWQLGLILIGPVPLIFLVLYLMGTRLHRLFLRIWRKWSDMTAVLSDTIPGMRVVKAFNQEDHERQRFGKRNSEVFDETFRIHHLWTSLWPLIYVLLNIMTVMVWVFALPRLLGDGGPGTATLSSGTFVAFLLYMGMFVVPIENFGFLVRMINRSLSSAYRVFEVLDSEPEVRERPSAKTLQPMRGRIEFENVRFGYDPVRAILKGVSFRVMPGEMIGLVGPSGAGKTTIINLLARFYDVTSGRIRVDGEDIRELDLGAYRRGIGMVMQDPYLFHGSILENICYGMEEIDLARAISAARTANAHDFICKLPQAYDTIVGERGHTLSGGERQRISIARAILHDPRILILDEATSSVDTETERKIQEALDRLTEGRTTIAIAHRLSTLTKADRLIVLKDGQVVEEGAHHALYEIEDGVYRKLVEMQRDLHGMFATG